ncbi:MAG: VWA domain-containing protein [Myxococcales bacterium]|nr:VWA domain-containing protein [Myxococcales bacterium]
MSRRRIAVSGLWLLVGALLWTAASVQLPKLVASFEAAGWHLARPNWLLAAGVAWLVPLFALGSLTDLPRWQQVLQTLVRMTLLILLALALAGPRARTTSPRGVQVIHLIDVSASMTAADTARAQQRIVGQLRPLKRLRSGRFQLGDLDPTTADLRVDVIRFDGRASRLPWPATVAADRDVPPLEALPQSRNLKTAQATDLEGALNVALALSDPRRIGHLVVWTDGVETRGDLSELTKPLRTAGLRVHMPADFSVAPAAEVLVERIDVPQTLRANLHFPLAIQIRSSHRAEARCTVTGKGDMPKPVTVKLRPGSQKVALGRVRIKTGGHHELTAACKVIKGTDRFASNNKIRARVVVQQRPKLLYIEGARGQARYLARALESDFEVEVRDASGVPRTVSDMKRYGAVILSDVARVSSAGVPQVTEGDMRAMGQYVKAGGGLLVLGGENSLGSGGYQNTWLDKHVLPVRMEIDSEIEQPSIAMVLAIDRSGSMSGAKMALAKEAARATADALGHEDKIGVIAFDNIARTVVRLQRAGNRYRIATNIARISAGGGTHIYPALQQSLTALERVRAKVKHVILLSDGQAPRSGIDALVRQMRRTGITVTTVGVGTAVDRSLLEAIADRGGGRSYFTDRPETLPRIFVRETRQLSGETVVEKKVRPRLVPKVGRIDMIRGIDWRYGPILMGFLTTKVKKGAEEILRVSTGQPLLVRWRLGLGKVTVWTSDLKNRWAHKWIDWPGYAVLARQMARDLLQEEMGMRLVVQLARERDRLRIAVDAVDEQDKWMKGLAGTADLTLPDGSKTRLDLPEVALGRYETTVPLSQFGPYDVQVKLRATAVSPVLASGGATSVHPYPEEFRLGASDLRGLHAVVAATGGKTAAKPVDWRDRQGGSVKSWRWLWLDFVRLALVLLLVDIALRRVRIGRAAPTSWYRK